MYYHVLEFVAGSKVDLERVPGQAPEQVLLPRGTWRRARVHPLDITGCVVETADLSFDDGTVARSVPFDNFVFAE